MISNSVPSEPVVCHLYCCHVKLWLQHLHLTYGKTVTWTSLYCLSIDKTEHEGHVEYHNMALG
jgi:hypothetical protein